MLCFHQATLDVLHAHACEQYPEECCGFVLSNGDTETVHRITNVQNLMHEKEPALFPRDATLAYFMDPKELFNVHREIDGGESIIKAVYHSHPNHDAYFSAEDKKQALFDGEPLYPDAVYLVMSIYDRQVRASSAFKWDDEERDFVDVPLGPPQRGPARAE
jgi:proteasome lid subunit RPN8/RPN11